MSYISDVTINGSNSPISASLRGNCSTASATAAKAVSCSNFDTLKEGVSIFVTFTNDNTASNPTLNVNSTGAKTIKNGTSEVKWEAGQTAAFLYDGTYWQMISSAGGSSFSGEEIEAVAADQIKIGNVVYTIEGGSPWATPFDGGVQTISFSPDRTKLVLGGNFTGYAKLYSVSGNVITYLQDIYADASSTALYDHVDSIAFSPDGTKLVLGGSFNGYAKLYSVSGNTITYLQDIYSDAGTTALDDSVESVSFSPDGTKLVLGGCFTSFAKLYSILGNTITYLQDIYADAGTTAFNNTVNVATFSPDGSKLVLCGYFTGYAKVYSINGAIITYVSDIYSNVGTTTLDDIVYSVVFSPDGTKLVLGGDFIGKAKLYLVSSNTVTFISNIYGDAGTTDLDYTVYSASFSPDGSKLVLGGWFTGGAKLYSVSGNSVSYLQDIYADAETAVLYGTVYSVSFSPDGTKIVLGGDVDNEYGYSNGHAKFYSVTGNSVTYLQDIYADTGTTALNSYAYSAAFSPDGTKLVLGGQFTGYAKLYSVSGNIVTYLQDIYTNAGTAALDDLVRSVSFSPDGTKLVLGGAFTGRAKLYSVSGNTVAYLQDIYADAGTTVLSSYVFSAIFSPDGTKLVLGGYFTGGAKLYSVSENSVSYLQDIPIALNADVCSATFSPDGTKLVLCGSFTGKAKLYSISGNTATYLQDIYANTGTTALNSYVNSATFSPDGTKLVLGGDFTGKAKLYSASGSSVTFISNIYADAGTSGFDDEVISVTFSPDGTKLVLGGNFSGYAKFYSVSDNTITYVSDIYADASSTVLSSTVYYATFSPDGSKLVLGGKFASYAKLYSVSDNSVTFMPYGIYAYKALNGLSLRFDSLGYAKTSAAAGESVTIESLVGSSSALFPDAEGNVF